MYSGESEARAKGENVVVGTGGYGLVGDGDGGLVDKAGGEGGGDGRYGHYDGRLVKWRGT